MEKGLNIVARDDRLEEQIGRAPSRLRPEVVRGIQPEPIAAPITVYSRRETDEHYEGVISRNGDLRIVNCPNNLQWIAQRFNGGQWRNKSFHRERLSLVRRYGPLKIILALPEHHDGAEPI